MKLKTLSSNSVLMKYFTGTVFWITFAYTLVMFILVPIALFIYSRVNELPFDSMVDASKSNILLTQGGFQLAVSMLFAAVVAVMLFNFKNKEASSDYIHGLPITRNNIFINAVTVGLLSILIPLLIISMTVILMGPILNLNITVANIVEWLLFTFITQAIVFIFSMFVGLLVNRINLHIEMIAIFFFLPVAFMLFVILAGEFFFNGVSTDILLNEKNIPQFAFPIFAIVQMVSPGYEVSKIVLWSILAIVLFIASFFLYKHRHNERVNEVFQFNVLYHIVVVLLTLFGMLIFGLLFTVLLPMSIWINIFMFSLGALVSYLLAMMFMQDSVRIKFELKNILIVLVSIVLFWTIFVVGWKTYVNYIPNEDNVEAVKVVDTNTGMQVYQEDNSDEYMKKGYGYSKNKADIETALVLHQKLTEGPRVYSNEETVGSIEIHYLTKNNKNMVRNFEQTSKSIKALQAQLEELDILALTERTDFLYNLKENLQYDSNSLQFFYYYSSAEEWNVPSKKIEAFRKNYVKEYAKLKDMNQDTVKYTGKLSVEVTPKDGYTNLMGTSSIYNPAVGDFLKTEKMPLSEILSLNEDYMSVYKIDLSKIEDRKTLYKDLNYMSSKELQKKYKITSLEGSEQKEALNQLDSFKFDTNGDTLLLVADTIGLEQNDEYPLPFTISVVVK